jgi:deazaflavin-dependent oxidoreductase (nitroreductase family)
MIATLLYRLAMPLTGEYAPRSVWYRKKVEQYESTGGTTGGTLRGRPVVVLTTVGARSGKLRKIAMMRVEHEGVYAVVASQGGAPTDPHWSHNLRADPRCELQDRSVKRDYLAREAVGEEKAMWWERAVAAWPDYGSYQRRTRRQIPVFILEPMDQRATSA